MDEHSSSAPSSSPKSSREPQGLGLVERFWGPATEQLQSVSAGSCAARPRPVSLSISSTRLNNMSLKRRIPWASLSLG